MSKELRIRRGTTAEHASFTGAPAEITIDTDKETVVVHDGVTVGGNPLATEAALDTINGSEVTPGSVLNSIKLNAADADYDNTTSGLTATTLEDAIDESYATIAPVAADVVTLTNRVTTNEGAIGDLETFDARTDNPHAVTAAQTGASAVGHTHVISNVTGLQDALNTKYDEITAVTDNLMGFGAGSVVIDTGIPRNGKLIVGVDV